MPIGKKIKRLKQVLNYYRKGTLRIRIENEYRPVLKKWYQYRWRYLTAGQEFFDARLQRGIKMRHWADSHLSNLIYCNNFEAVERSFLNAFLRDGDIFLDVGANIGLYTLIAANCVGVTGHVYAFEPTEKTYQRLVENVGLNDLRNVTCLMTALSDKAGEFPLFTMQNEFDAWNSFAHPQNEKNEFHESMAVCERLDDFASKHELAGRINMLKIDVEGWESKVIQGAEQVLLAKNSPVLQVEFTDEAAQAAGSSCNALYRQLQELGYKMYRYDCYLKEVIPDSLRSEYPYVNLIAAKHADQIYERLGKP